MKNNCKFDGCFDLNEVLDLVCPHVDSMTKTIIFNGYKDYSEFLCSYAPYTIVSDIAANEKLATEGFDKDALVESVDLHPVSLAGRVCKSAILSEGRAAFWMGFFSKSHNNKNISDEEMSKIMDRIYGNVKYLSRKGGDTLARVLSYYYAKRALSLYQIFQLGELIRHEGEVGSSSSIKLGIIILALECNSFRDLQRAVKMLGAIGHDFESRYDGHYCIPNEKNFLSRGVMRWALTVKCVAACRYYNIEHGSTSSFGDTFVSFLTDLSLKSDKHIDGWLWLFVYGDKEKEDIWKFSEDVWSILLGKFDA